ncbi:MAG TPA: S8 family serine peptidase, partial [Solirubrobacteraceae bacterium]
MRARAAALALLALAAAPSAARAAQERAVSTLRPEPGVLLVAPAPGADPDALASRAGGRAAGRIAGTRFTRVTVDPARAATVLHRLRRDPRVASVQRNHRRTALAAPNDPLFAKGRQPYLSTLRLPQAWDLQPSAADQRIAIIDSGIDADHPEFAGRLLPGRDILEADDDPDDAYGHGTEVAGVAAAGTGDDRGIAGVAPGAKIIPVRVLDDHGTGYDDDVAAGITWAADHGAGVINLSLGGPESSPVLVAAVAHARAKDAVVVAAAGNDGVPAA